MRSRTIFPKAATTIALATAIALAAISVLGGNTAQAQSTSAAKVLSFEGESMSFSPSSAGAVSASSGASGGKALDLWSPATATKTVSLPSAADGLVVWASGAQCRGAPHMSVKVGGAQVLSTDVTVYNWQDYSASLSPAVSGSQKVEITFSNDYSKGRCDRNLWIDKVTFTSSGASTPLLAPSLSSSASSEGGAFVSGTPADTYTLVDSFGKLTGPTPGSKCGTRAGRTGRYRIFRRTG